MSAASQPAWGAPPPPKRSSQGGSAHQVENDHHDFGHQEAATDDHDGHEGSGGDRDMMPPGDGGDGMGAEDQGMVEDGNDEAVISKLRERKVEIIGQFETNINQCISDLKYFLDFLSAMSVKCAAFADQHVEHELQELEQETQALKEEEDSSILCTEKIELMSNVLMRANAAMQEARRRTRGRRGG